MRYELSLRPEKPPRTRSGSRSGKSAVRTSTGDAPDWSFGVGETTPQRPNLERQDRTRRRALRPLSHHLRGQWTLNQKATLAPGSGAPVRCRAWALHAARLGQGGLSDEFDKHGTRLNYSLPFYFSQMRPSPRTSSTCHSRWRSFSSIRDLIRRMFRGGCVDGTPCGRNSHASKVPAASGFLIPMCLV